jgi:hypothetical protein
MTRRRSALAIGALAVAAAVGLALASADDASAQRLDPRRPTVLVVGRPRGPSPMARVDARRTGLTRDLLPHGTLRLSWRRTLGLAVDQPALVTPDGTLAVVTTRGDVVFLDPETGDEIAQVTVGGGAGGPAAVLSDGTVVFVTNSGDVVGVKRPSARARFTTRIGGERSSRAAPLPLDDGGVVVATTTDLVVLDAEGSVRARVTLPEGPATPILSNGDRLLTVSSTGTVYAWAPGREPVRLGSFGGAVDGAVALTETGTLVGVVDGAQVVDVDLARGGRSTRAVAPQGLYLGPVAARPGALTMLSMTPTRAFIVTLDAAGQETLRAPIGTVSTPALPDGGVAPLVAPPHAGVLVDARGAVAFAAPDGHVGVVAPDGSLDTIGELVCTRAGRSAGVAGLTPLGRGAFAVTCEAGAVVRVTGPERDAPRP